MSAKESSAQKNNKQEQQPAKRPEVEPSSPESDLVSVEQGSTVKLPEVPTNRRLRQSQILRLQRQHGNSYVQRMLSGQEEHQAANVQRQEGSEPEPNTETGPVALIVDDSAADLMPGQMRKREFLKQLEDAVCAVSDEALAGTLYSAVGCPYINRVFKRLPGKPAAEIERMVHLFAPGTKGAESAQSYLTPVSNRIRAGIARWLETGQVTGVPPPISQLGAAVGEKTPVKATNSGGEFIKRKADEAGQGEPEALRIQRALGDGRPLDGGTRSRMEKGFGRSFGDIVLHTDGQAAQLAREQDARAFTVGRHVAFGGGEYRPGTLVGDALLAHELAHAIQQEGAPPQVQRAGRETGALESDADRAAIGLMARLWGGAQGRWATMQQNALPTLRSGLRLQRCRTRSHEEKLAAKKHLHNLLADPDKNADAIIKYIDDLGSDAGEIVQMVERLTDEQLLKSLAGTERGEEIIEKVIEAIKSSGAGGHAEAVPFENILKELREERKNLSEDTEKAIERINKAITADPRRSEYAKDLILPVTILPNAPVTGGVYYDSSMPKAGDEKTHVGLTELVTREDTKGEVSFPLTFIKLGPRILSFSDNYIRSTLYHEFQHYQRFVEFRKSDTEQDEESMTLEEEAKAGTRVNNEVEATSKQLASDFDLLNDDELRTVVRYLAEHFAEPAATQKFKDKAVSRIMTVMGSDEAKLTRLLGLIEGIPAGEQKALAGLAKAVKAKLPKKKKKKKKKKGKKSKGR